MTQRRLRITDFAKPGLTPCRHKEETGSGLATGSLSRRDTPILGTQPDPYHPLSAAESLTQVSDISLICRQWFTMRQLVQGRTPKAHSSLQPRQSMTRPLDTLILACSKLRGT